MPDCKLCGDVGLTLEHALPYPDFCNCEIGHALNDRVHDYAYTLEQGEETLH